MAVLVKDIGSSAMSVRLLLGGRTKIDVHPSGSHTGITRLIHGEQSGNMRVKVNGQERQLPVVVRGENQKTSGSGYIAKIVQMANGGVQVITPTIDVATDGKRVVVFGDDYFRNTTCGICGDFDGEKTAEMRSPRDIPLSSGTLLVASYAFNAPDDSDKCEVDQQIKHRIEQEEKMAELEPRHRSRSERRQLQKYLQRMGRSSQENQMSSSSSSESRENNQRSGSGETHRRVNPVNQQAVRKEGSETCFSVDRQTVCPKGARIAQESKIRKVVRFACAHDQQQARRLEQRIRESGEYVDFAQQQYQSLSQKNLRVPIPTECRWQQ